MKKIIMLTFSIIFLLLISLAGYYCYKTHRIKHATKLVELKTSEVEVFTKKKVKDIIQNMNGTLMTNPTIDTTTVGIQEVTFQYKTDNNIIVPYTIHVNVVDNTPPLISYPGTYRVEPNSITRKELNKQFFCGDNYDDHPKCFVEGEYNLKKEGEYKVSLKGIDSSHNTSKNPFLLVVKKEEKISKKEENISEAKTISFEEIKKKYKKKNTKIGIDISYWQGNINFKKLKKSNVEFAYIRVGRREEIHGKLIEDDKFEEYIKGLNKVKIPVGVYFYSKASNIEEIKEEVKWILKRIKKHQVDLEIVMDWENWDHYQDYQLSFYHLSKLSDAFTKEVEKKDYTGMLYSSKYYLETVWNPEHKKIWLAHYTDKTDYNQNFKVWQICNNGKVPGIEENQVDIDIRYES